VGILRGGVTATAHHGVADVKTAEPVTPETRFNVGSFPFSVVEDPSSEPLPLHRHSGVAS